MSHNGFVRSLDAKKYPFSNKVMQRHVGQKFDFVYFDLGSDLKCLVSTPMSRSGI